MRMMSRIAITIAVSIATIAGSVGASATAAPTVAPATVLGSISDGPGNFNIFRTVDSGKQANPVDTAACNAYFGFPRSIAVIQRLDARLYTFTNSPRTGFLTNPTAKDAGPIFVCGTLGLDGQSIYEQYSRTTAPGLGLLTMSGPCGLSLYLPEAGRGGADCVQRINPNSTGVTGGVASSNSVINPLRLPGGTTGSLWTFYTTGTGTAPVPEPVPGSAPDTGSVKYSVGREVNSVSAGAEFGCPGGVRRTQIHPVAVDPATGKPGEPSASSAADATICYQNPGTPDFSAALNITVRGVNPPLTQTTIGHCRQTTLPTISGSKQQTCGFTLPSDLGRGLTGGQVTLNGLVPNNDAAGSTNSAVWSIGVLGPIAPTL